MLHYFVHFQNAEISNRKKYYYIHNLASSIKSVISHMEKENCHILVIFLQNYAFQFNSNYNKISNKKIRAIFKKTIWKNRKKIIFSFKIKTCETVVDYKNNKKKKYGKIFSLCSKSLCFSEWINTSEQKLSAWFSWVCLFISLGKSPVVFFNSTSFWI